MIALALLASLTAEPPKEKLVSGVVTAVSASSVTVGGESYRLTKDTQYLLESGFDPRVGEAKDLVKGKAVDLAVADGVAVRVFIKRLVPLGPGEVLKLEVGLAEERTDKLLKTMEGYRKTFPEARGLGEMNGFTVGPGKDGKTYTLTHLNGVANRLGVKTRAECMALLTYLKDPDDKLRHVAAFAIEAAVKAYPGGMSTSDIKDVESEGHRNMVKAFTAGIEKLPK
jgi:hypothetical protein